jgi:hypothetical protein
VKLITHMKRARDSEPAKWTFAATVASALIISATSLIQSRMNSGRIERHWAANQAGISTLTNSLKAVDIPLVKP